MKPLTILILCLLFSACQTTPKVNTTSASLQTVLATVSSVNSGTVRAEKLAELSFGAVGRVKALNVHVGDIVKKGQVLAELENEDLISMLSTAKSELARRTKLNATRAVSDAELEQIQREVQTTQVAYEKSMIVAPYDGLIAELNLEVGQLSQITAVVPRPLMRIVDLETRYIRAEIDEVDLPRIHVGQKATVAILAIRKEPFRAIVRKVVPYISTIREQDRTAEIELTIDTGGIFLPAGASADVEVIVDTKENAVSLPTRSILGRGNQRHVFLFDNGRVKKQPVTLGIFNYDITEILSGVKVNDQVILPSEGLELEDGMSVKKSAL